MWLPEPFPGHCAGAAHERLHAQPGFTAWQCPASCWTLPACRRLRSSAPTAPASSWRPSQWCVCCAAVLLHNSTAHPVRRGLRPPLSQAADSLGIQLPACLFPISCVYVAPYVVSHICRATLYAVLAKVRLWLVCGRVGKGVWAVVHNVREAAGPKVGMA